MENPKYTPEARTRLQRLNNWVFVLEEGHMDTGGFIPYYEALEESFAHYEVFNQLIDIGEILDTDQELLTDGQHSEATRAFVKGGVIALDVAAEVLGKQDAKAALSQVIEEMRCSYDAIQDDSQLEFRPSLESDGLRYRSQLGHMYAGAYHEFIDVAKEVLVNKKEHTASFEQGFGFIMYATMVLLLRADQKDLEAFATEINEGARDWDAFKNGLSDKAADHDARQARAHEELMRSLMIDFSDAQDRA